MDSFKAKLDILNYKNDMPNRINKHLMTLNLVSFENMNQIIGYLLEKGIIIADKNKMIIEPDDFTILLNDFATIKERVEEYEKLGELDALKEDLSRLNSASATRNLAFLKQSGKPYKTPDNKYANAIFRLSKFKRDSYEKPNVVSIKEDNKKQENSSFEDILSKPQTIGLTSENYDRYEELYGNIKNIMLNVYGIEEVNNNIINNLIKLVTNNVPNNKAVIFEAVTYGKNITQEEANRLKEAINDELDYTNIMNFNIGGRAA